MKKLQILLPVLLVFSCLALDSCKKEEPMDPDKVYINLGGETWHQSELDIWLYDNFVKPYNIEVRYRWDYHQVERRKIAVPVNEKLVRPVMNMLMTAWAEPYQVMAGDSFIKTWGPKTLYLMGSYTYDADGSRNAGEAENGITVRLNRINMIETGGAEVMRKVLYTMHHEFAHILHQNRDYPPAFEKITPSGYLSNWNVSNNTLSVANSMGFTTQYSRASPNEDFVETLATILIYGRSHFDAIVASTIPAGAETSPAATALREKETMIKDYLKTVWDINLYDSEIDGPGLETLIQEAIEEVVAKGI